MDKERIGGKAKEGKKGILVNATIPQEQYEAIKKLEGVMGTNENGVVSNIINMWLYSQDWFLDIVKQKINKNVKDKK
ncbi:hypothetical protein ES703_80113 [subsurface metagenome]